MNWSDVLTAWIILTQALSTQCLLLIRFGSLFSFCLPCQEIIVLPDRLKMITLFLTDVRLKNPILHNMSTFSGWYMRASGCCRFSINSKRAHQSFCQQDRVWIMCSWIATVVICMVEGEYYYRWLCCTTFETVLLRSSAMRFDWFGSSSGWGLRLPCMVLK